MNELRDGLWHWQAPHPEWSPDEPWPEVVSSYAIDDGARLLLVDPLAVPEELLDLAGDREPVVVLTAPWHERDTRELVERFSCRVYTPPPDTPEDLMRKFDATREEVGDGSPDLRWLIAGDRERARLYAAGDRLPIGIEAFLGREHNDLLLWVDRVGAVISGDTLVDFGHGFGINESLRGGMTHEQVVDRLRQLLSLPVELVLPTHGAPTDRAALERAMSR